VPLEIFGSVLGISISVIFGVIGIYLTIKSRYPGQITLVNEQTIESFDAVGSTVDGLSVTYYGQEIKDNLVLLNGAFINTGKTDITTSMVEQPITLKLLDGYKRLSGKVVQSKVESKLVPINSNTISISTGLFRCGECVRFHALAQLPDNKNGVSNARNLKKSIEFKHRITNTRSINEESIYQTQAKPNTIIVNGSVFFKSILILFCASIALTSLIMKTILLLLKLSNTSQTVKG